MMRPPVALPPSTKGKERAMASFEHPKQLAKPLANKAKELREEAKLLPPGAVRDATIRAARQANTAAHLAEWVNSPGLQPPE